MQEPNNYLRRYLLQASQLHVQCDTLAFCAEGFYEMDAVTTNIMTNSLPSDQMLLQACRDGDSQGWSRLLDKYERLVYSIPLNYGLSRDDAADIAQIVFTSLLQSLDDLREDSNLAGWLATVARRHSWRVLARGRREVSDPLDGESIQALLPKNASEIERWELVEWVHSSLGSLDERCRRLLVALSTLR